MDEDLAKQYPEHAKLAAPLPAPITKTSELSQKIGEFLDWLKGEGVCLMHWREDDGWSGTGYVAEQRGTVALLADYFKIDNEELDREKRRMLAVLRAGQSERGPRADKKPTVD